VFQTAHMAIEPKNVDLSAVVGLIAANPGEASETVVEGARPHRDRSLSFGSKCAVEVDDGFHRRHPCVKGRTAEGFTMNPRLVEPGFAVVFLHADVPARPGQDENRENDAEVARHHGRRQDTCTARCCARRAHRVSGSSPKPLPIGLAATGVPGGRSRTARASAYCC